MGLFLQTAILKNNTLPEIEGCLKEISAEYPDMCLEADALKYHNYKDAVGVLFNDEAAGFEPLAQVLSVKLKTPVLLLYIYDEDFWGYYFYNDGMESDSFCPLPDYFDEEASEAEEYKGDAGVISRYFEVDRKEIERYLTRWTDELLGEVEIKAYPDDEFCYGDCWQMADFMKRLGYPYVYDETADTEDDGEEITIPCLNEILSQKLPPRQPAFSPAEANIPYKIGNLPNALDYDYISGLLQNGTYEYLAELGSMEITMAVIMLQKKVAEKAVNGKKAYQDPALHTLLAFCYHWLGDSYMRYWSLYSALDLAPRDVMLLRARGLVAAIHSKPHIGIQDMTTLLELDPENRDLYLLCRAFFCFMNPKWDMACNDVKELIRIGFPAEDDPRICRDGFTKEFEQFVYNIINDIPMAPKKSLVEQIREERQAKKEQHKNIREKDWVHTEGIRQDNTDEGRGANRFRSVKDIELPSWSGPN